MRFKAAAQCLIPFALALVMMTVPAAAQDRKLNLVGFGDSLMAGYQLPPEEALPAKLQKALRAKGFSVDVVNAGVSGDTSTGGLARVDWSVPDGTDGVVLELGANDALRGIQPEQTEKNLDAILAKFQQRKIPVLFVGMIAPPNMGGEYAERFNPIYERLAQKYQVAFHPFILDGVVTKAELQLEDGMHPNAKGIDVMVERLLPVAERFVSTILAEPK